MNVHSFYEHSHEQPAHGANVDLFSHELSQLLLAMLFIVALLSYIIAVAATNRKKKRWPLHRSACWMLGCLLALYSVIGPIADRSYHNFTAHMVSHLLLGMLAPLLMALAAPITLLLRSLSVPLARRLTFLLKGWLARWLTNPLVTTLLNVGGLWYLYTSNLYMLMHEYTMLHIFVHVHIFIAGYLFTVSMIYIDPVHHRTSYVTRSIVLIIALAGHGMLSKIIYVIPPQGVPADQAERGGMLMYYGGDLIEVLIIFILCMQWYRATRPRLKPSIVS